MFRRTVAVILLTFLNIGCALFSDLSSDQFAHELSLKYEDPVAREAFKLRDDPTETGVSQWDSRDASIKTYQMGRKQQEIQAALESGDITLGMNMSEVISSWGRPRDIEMADNSGLGNQKWVYRDGLFQQSSVSVSKIVYFERGQVVGWESQGLF